MSSRSFRAREKSMPGSKGQANSHVRDLKLKPNLIYHPENLITLKNYAKSTLMVLYK